MQMQEKRDSSHWNVNLFRPDGRWVSFRAPMQSLQRVGVFFTLIFILSAISLTGWLLTRWEVFRLKRELISSELKSSSLNMELLELKRRASGDDPESFARPGAPSVSLMPSLGEDEFRSGFVHLESINAEYSGASREWSLEFDLVREVPGRMNEELRWIALLHGVRGILAFPSAFESRKGDLVLSNLGELLSDMKLKRNVKARFQVSDFVDQSGISPVYATVLIYDSRGTLLLRQRTDLKVKK